MQDDFKLLVRARSGLNDTFSAVAYYIDFFNRNHLNYENLHFTSEYGDLNQYFDIEKIKYIKDPNPSIYNFISDYCNGRDTNLNINSKEHISNFIKVKSNIQKDFKKYENYIGLHFRFINLEMDKEFYESEHNFYLESFFKIYNKNEKYIVCSDSTIINDMLNNIDNVTILTCGENINNHEHNVKVQKRKDTIINALSDLFALASCKVIYKTKGHFTNLCKLFNHNINIKNLI